jgi:hypothetical protein
MQQLIHVRPEPPGQFTAVVVGIPELRATAATRRQAIEQVERLLAEAVVSGELVLVDVPEPNPLLKWAGWTKDDPNHQIYLEELARLRREDLEDPVA